MKSNSVFLAIEEIGGRIINKKSEGNIDMVFFSHDKSVFDLVIVGDRVEWFYDKSKDVIKPGSRRKEAILAIRRMGK